MLFSSHHIEGVCFEDDSSLDHLAEVPFVRFLCREVTLSALLPAVRTHGPHLVVTSYAPPPGGGSVYELLGILYGRLNSSPPFISLFSYLHHCGHMDIDFTLWVIVQYCYLFCCSNCTSFGYWEPCQLASVSCRHMSTFFPHVSLCCEKL